MTQLQTGMLAGLFAGGDQPAYHNVTAIPVAAPFDGPALRRAADRVVRRHAALRTPLHAAGFADPLAIVHGSARMRLTAENLRDLPGADQLVLQRQAVIFDPAFVVTAASGGLVGAAPV